MGKSFKEWLEGIDPKGATTWYGLADAGIDIQAFDAQARLGGTIDEGKYDRGFKILTRKQRWVHELERKLVDIIQVQVFPLE